jgi:hypothetical protein
LRPIYSRPCDSIDIQAVEYLSDTLLFVSLMGQCPLPNYSSYSQKELEAVLRADRNHVLITALEANTRSCGIQFYGTYLAPMPKKPYIH